MFRWSPPVEHLESLVLGQSFVHSREKFVQPQKTENIAQRKKYRDCYEENCRHVQAQRLLLIAYGCIFLLQPRYRLLRGGGEISARWDLQILLILLEGLVVLVLCVEHFG